MAQFATVGRRVLSVMAVVGAVWAVRTPGSAPLSRLGGVPSTGADCRPSAPYARVCQWRTSGGEHTVAWSAGSARVQVVRHQWWWAGDTVEWRRIGDSVQAALTGLRARPVACARMLRPVGARGQRYEMRGYEAQYYEYRWPARDADSTGRSPVRLGVELYAGAAVPPCDGPPSGGRRMTVRAVEAAVGRLIASALGLA